MVGCLLTHNNEACPRNILVSSAPMALCACGVGTALRHGTIQGSVLHSQSPRRARQYHPSPGAAAGRRIVGINSTGNNSTGCFALSQHEGTSSVNLPRKGVGVILLFIPQPLSISSYNHHRHHHYNSHRSSSFVWHRNLFCSCLSLVRVEMASPPVQLALRFSLRTCMQHQASG